MEVAKKQKVDNIEEKPHVTTNMFLAKMQEAETILIHKETNLKELCHHPILSSIIEVAKKQKVESIEENSHVTTNPFLDEIQEVEKVATKPHSKDEIEEVAKSEVESLESEVSWVCPWGRHGSTVDMSTYEEWPDYFCFDNLNDSDCLDDLSDNDEEVEL